MGGKYALKAGERFEMHSPRHSLVTYSVSHGADPMAVQGLLRHSNVAYGFVTLRSWAKPRPFGRPRLYSDGILQAVRNGAVIIKVGVVVE